MFEAIIHSIRQRFTENERDIFNKCLATSVNLSKFVSNFTAIIAIDAFRYVTNGITKRFL